MKKVFGFIFLGVLLTSCLGKFVEDELTLDLQKEQTNISSYISNNNLKPTLDQASGIYYTITKTNPSGESATNASDYLIAYSLKTLEGTNIVTKAISDSVLINFSVTQVFEGFSRSMILLKEGEKGQFIIPFQLAYGSNPPEGVAKNATILADIEILESRNENERIDIYLKKKKIINAEKTSTGVRIHRFNVSTDSPALKEGDKLSIKYTGMFLNDRVFDPGTRPIDFTVGSAGLIKGFIEALGKLKKGEKAKVVIPYEQAYGKSGTPDKSIPPYTPIAFDVEIIAVNGM